MAISILVNSPKFVVHDSPQDETFGINNPLTGYITEWYLGVDDACGSPNPVTAMPMNETFPNGISVAPGVSGWKAGNASPMTWNIGDWEGMFFKDGIGEVCSPCSPQATWTSSKPPYRYNSVLQSGSHYFFAGTTTSAAGWVVYTGTILYFQDHGANSP